MQFLYLMVETVPLILKTTFYFMVSQLKDGNMIEMRSYFHITLIHTLKRMYIGFAGRILIRENVWNREQLYLLRMFQV